MYTQELGDLGRVKKKKGLKKLTSKLRKPLKKVGTVAAFAVAPGIAAQAMQMSSQAKAASKEQASVAERMGVTLPSEERLLQIAQNSMPSLATPGFAPPAAAGPFAVSPSTSTSFAPAFDQPFSVSAQSSGALASTGGFAELLKNPMILAGGAAVVLLLMMKGR